MELAVHEKNTRSFQSKDFSRASDAPLCSHRQRISAARHHMIQNPFVIQGQRPARALSWWVFAGRGRGCSVTPCRASIGAMGGRFLARVVVFGLLTSTPVKP
jgi:hypothetical protein